MFLSIYIYSENSILKDCVITLEYVEIVFVAIVAVKQNVLNPDGCLHSSESYLRQVGEVKMLGRYRYGNSNLFVLSQAVKKDVAGQKMVWELLSSSQMQLIFLKLVDTTDICVLPGKIPAHTQATFGAQAYL